MIASVRHYFLVTIAAFLVACSSIGVEADTPTKRLAAAYTSVQTVAQLTEQQLSTGNITVKDAQAIKASNDAVLLGLDATRTLYLTNPVAAEQRLAQILVVLQATQSYLNSRGGK